jgi:hypothetical protein
MSSGLKAHFAGEYTNPATCWKVTLTNGDIKGFTDNDVDLVIGDLTYLAASGYNTTDVETSNALNVDNLEITGILNSPSITAVDLQAGLYDTAAIKIFEVNWSDLTQGSYSLRDGTVGQVTTDRDRFIAELQGMMDAFKRSFGKLCTPLCPYNFGDFPFPAPYRGRCLKDLTTFTKLGTLESVSADGFTFYDSARTEPGPGVSGIAITGITNANPGVVSLASPLGLADFATVTIAGAVGPDVLNTTTIIRNPSGNTFELPIDTSDTGAYPPYVSGGTVTPLGGDSGYFDNGLFTITDVLSPNVGLTREIKSYIPGQWTVQNSFPYPFVGNEAYTIIGGCIKTPGACKAHSNYVNFGAFEFVPGQDKAIQVAQPQSGQTGGSKK